jgi:predicted peroxiredoxin
MSRYILIQSRDPFSSAEAVHDLELAAELARAGGEVTLFLVQNGVLPARRCARSGPLVELARQGVQVLCDDFSLRVRGIAESRLATGIKAAPIEVVLEAICDGGKAIWH